MKFGKLHLSACLLWLAVTCFSTARGAEERAPANAGVTKLSIEEFDKLRQDKDAQVIDVRTPAEYEAGHVPGAVNIPIGSKDFDEKAKSLDKEKKHLVYCAIGGRSGKATKRMDELGVKDVYDFSGGMRAWKEAEKPVERGREKKAK